MKLLTTKHPDGNKTAVTNHRDLCSVSGERGRRSWVRVFTPGDLSVSPDSIRMSLSAIHDHVISVGQIDRPVRERSVPCG